MRRVCIYHAGCPDGFGAAWAAWRAWGDDALYVARGHEDPLRARDYAGDFVLFADIAPSPPAARALAEEVAQLWVLDHHVSARDRFAREPDLTRELAHAGHRVLFDLAQSGAGLTWRALHEEDAPPLIAYVEDQDLWRWKLPASREVNAAIQAAPRSFAAWNELAATSPEDLAREGEPIVRAQDAEITRALQNAHPVAIGPHRVEAVNARWPRAEIGHALSQRAAYGVPCGAVYRLIGRSVDVSLYSIGEFDAAQIAVSFGGGGHRNAAGFSVPLADWLARFVG